MHCGPYVTVIKPNGSQLEDGIYCEFFTTTRRNYAYYIIKDKVVVLKLEFCDGRLTWVTPYENGITHGISRMYTIHGREIKCINKLIIHGKDFTAIAKLEGIDFDSGNDFAFMLLKYS